MARVVMYVVVRLEGMHWSLCGVWVMQAGSLDLKDLLPKRCKVYYITCRYNNRMKMALE